MLGFFYSNHFILKQNKFVNTYYKKNVVNLVSHFKISYRYNRERDSPRKKEVTSHDENEISLIHQKSPSPIKSKIKRSQPLCLFCHQPGYREEEIGKLHILNKVIVHYYCLVSHFLSYNYNETVDRIFIR